MYLGNCVISDDYPVLETAAEVSAVADSPHIIYTF